MADHYIRQGATGAADGSNWTNAWTDLPANFVRGDTYYVADGSYGGHTFSTIASGTDYIYIKKAIATDHGTDIGWNDAYGDGEATFTAALRFTSGYWEINGQTRNTDWKTGYGFAIDFDPGTGEMFEFNGQSYITAKYIEMDANTQSSAGDCVYCVATQGANSTGVRIQYCYLHDVGRCPLISRNNDGWIVEYNYFKFNGLETVAHPEVWSSYPTSSPWVNDNNIFRFNIMEDCVGSGLVLWGGDGWELYGNLAFETGNHPTRATAISDGIFGNWLGKDQSQFGSSNCKIYNNTFVDISSVSNVGIPLYSGESGNEVYNNLWIGWTGTLSFLGAQTHDYNGFSDSNARSEAHAQTSMPTTIFLDYGSQDFTLAAATDAGTTLASPYNTDMDGNTRGADGTWDRGAYEYDSGGTPPGARLVMVLR